MRTDGVLDGVGDSPAAALHVELVQLSDRRRTIISTLDSLEQSGGAWRGAMAGLRASVADLEYRVDAFELGLAATGAELDVLLAGWLEEADRGIEALYRAAADSAPDPFRDERLELHSHVNQLNERSASFAGRTGDAELGARRAFGRETIGMRRRLRAVIRSVQRASQPVPD
jgi:PAS domain-containing protein